MGFNLRHVLLLLAINFMSVKAGVLSAHFERLFLFAAYQLDTALIEGFPDVKPKIAPGCVGTRPDKRCYFHELANFIRPADNPPFTQIVKDDTPDIKTTANLQLSSGFKSKIDWTKVVPGITVQHHDQGFNAVMSRVGEIREELIGKKSPYYDKQVKQMTTTYELAIKFREFEAMEDEAKNFRKWAKSQSGPNLPPSLPSPRGPKKEPEYAYDYIAIDPVKAENELVKAGDPRAGTWATQFENWKTTVFPFTGGYAHFKTIIGMKDIKPKIPGCL